MAGQQVPDAAERSEQLRVAEQGAARLFEAIAAHDLLSPGRRESEISTAIKELAAQELGVRSYWHKRVIRVGPNTLHPYDDNPPDRVLGDDDIAFVDLGPIFAEWEADFGRTFVLGDDPVKQRLRDDVERAWAAGKEYFDDNPACTGADLYAFAVAQAREMGWEFGGEIAGHLIGEFPHVRIDDDEIGSYVVPQNTEPMRSIDPLGRPRHWIQEIHFVDRQRQIGGFFEQLLTI